jgi:hypothetical protein
VLRRVAYGKAILAGSAGALAWEIAARGMLYSGIKIPDVVHVLGTLILGESSPYWWLAGIIGHCAVGSIWTTFYAYFVWDELPLPPAIQGFCFSMAPAILAGLIMLPQFDLMHPMILDGRMGRIGLFAHQLGMMGPIGVFLGHAIFGLVMGALYTHPVGYRTHVKAVKVAHV